MNLKRNQILDPSAIFLLLIANSCTSLVVIKQEHVQGSLSGSKDYSIMNGTVFYNSWDSQGQIYQTEVYGANAATFRVDTLWDSLVFGRDQNAVYYKGLLLPNADPMSFKEAAFKAYDLNLEDKSSRLIRSLYFVDKDSVYFSTAGKILEVDGADPETFRQLNQSWQKDKNSIFLYSKPFPNADYSTFQVIYGPWGRDHQKVWVLDKEIVGADIESFEIIRESSMFLLSKDKNFVYLGAKTVEFADPTSFKMIKIDKAVDVNADYTFGPFSRKAK